jgi:molybdopterin biosynthesis enzyme
MVAARASGFPVKKGDTLCGMRVIPLAIKKEKLDAAKLAAGEAPLFRLLPIRQKRYGLIVTGGEIKNGRTSDKFSPVIREKLAEYGCELAEYCVLGDNHTEITVAIGDMLNAGAELVLCTGCMSVDPDDRTPLAIKNAAPNVVSYGAPVLPGAMFMLAYTADNRPVCGLPGCVMYARRTVFDIVLPHLLAGEPVSAAWLAGLGNGGLCLNCGDCRYPNCMFGKGV